MKPFLFFLVTLLYCDLKHSEPSSEMANYLLNNVQEWGKYSDLQSLKIKQLQDDDIEFRFWGFNAIGTQAVVLRRESNQWKALKVEIQLCEVLSVKGDVDTSNLMHFQIPVIYTDQIDCNKSAEFNIVPDILHVTEYVSVIELSENLDLDGLWNELNRLKVKKLESEAEPAPNISKDVHGNVIEVVNIDGYDYLVELKIGDVYRASVAKSKSQSELDAQLQEMAQIIVDYLNTSIYDEH